MTKRIYQVGGSLHNDAPTYVTREADTQLYQALNRGEFCYVLNSRQMGKSSLLVRTYYQLKEEGFECASIDMTSIGSQNITPEQWYKSIIADLWRSFQLIEKFTLKTWWLSQKEISDVQKLSRFIEELILVQFPTQKICIFIDEIDSILSLNFPVDDFFALIRYFYNQRSINPEYHRINFAIFGVATPSDLIQDRKRTPFNIGTAIELHGFTPEEIQPLAAALPLRENHAQAMLKEILSWTGGQPFLTNKLCQLVMDFITLQGNNSCELPLTSKTNTSRNNILCDVQNKFIDLPLDYEKLLVDNIVVNKILSDWQSQDDPEHLRTIQSRLLCKKKKVEILLEIYQNILLNQIVKIDDSPEQKQLFLSGLVVKESGLLKVKNRIYERVFNLEWIEKKLISLRPYAQAFDAWIASQKTDESSLLLGLALKNAEAWARGKSLSDLDYQYLDASVEKERQEKRTIIEAERIKEVEARLKQKQTTARFKKLFLAAVSIAFLAVSGWGMTTFSKYRIVMSSQRQENLAKIQSIVRYSEALFALDRQLDSIIQVLKARREFQKLRINEPQTEKMIELALRRSIYGAMESNNFVASNTGIIDIDFSEDSQQIVIGSESEMVVRRIDGTLLARWPAHQGQTLTVAISPDGKTLASGSGDTTVKLWKPNGDLLHTFRSHQAPVYDVKFSPDGEIIASASMDRTIKLWRKNGTLWKTLRGHQAVVRKVAFSPDGKTLASVCEDGKMKLWYIEEKEPIPITLTKGKEALLSLDFSPDGKLLAVGDSYGKVQLWELPEGELLKTFTAQTARVLSVVFNPDGKILASASEDGTIAFWNQEGVLLTTIKADQGSVRGLAFSSNGKVLASGGSDSRVKLWRLENPLLTRLFGHTAGVHGVAFSADNQLIGSVSSNETILWESDGSIKKKIPGKNSAFADIAFSPKKNIFAISAGVVVELWQTDGKLLETLKEHEAEIRNLAFSPDGKLLASASIDRTVKLWSLEGDEVTTFKDHQAGVWGVAFNGDGSLIASSSGDGTVRLWEQDGDLFKILSTGGGIVYSVAASNNDFWVGIGNGGKSIKLWNEKGELISTIETNNQQIFQVAVSPDGKIIAVGDDKGTVQLWQRNGEFLVNLFGHSSGIRGLAFSNDGKTLATAAEDRKVILWDLEKAIDFEQILVYGCEWVGNYLRTNAEVEESDRSLCDDIGF
ncbi:MAG: hypothetical protein F6K40_13510 [Okeania sp. SIO3I5]|uniref:WD40 domain-containing protein n=1 Tax=Okeania sp. SIO3I5 TaxID=2607805 RepID=UPI0013B936F2|nr:AAA-like domain-containing protein [Okeania sp. SIO3I5]NEQ37227.1 hypothetical protein [Okeania sp. SIO3I5]